MKLDKIIGNILDGIAKGSVNATNHYDRIRKDKLAYEFIREICKNNNDNENKIKYWDDYYVSVKRSIIV